MAQTLVPAELHQRWELALATSVVRRERAAELMAESAQNQTWSERVRCRSMALRECPPDRSTRGLVGFRIEGLVDDEPCVATFADDVLTCPAELRRRAEIVVALRETFPVGDGRAVPATLDGALGAVCATVMRAFSQIISLDLRTGEGGAR